MQRGRRWEESPSPPSSSARGSSPSRTPQAGHVRRLRGALLCVLGVLACLLAVALLTLCVAFTGQVNGPFVPWVLDAVESFTGLTVADAELTAWLLEPPQHLPTAGRPTDLLSAKAIRSHLGAAAAAAAARGASIAAPVRPNILIILADDMGYADPHLFGQHVWGRSNNTTPNLDRLAREGLMLTQYLTEPICTPARAALLTGRYPHRYGMTGDVLPQRVIYTPGSPTGLPKREISIATALKAAGYRTGLTGKWHLGISAAPKEANGTNVFLPAHHGFDDSLVWPFSNFQRCSPYVGDERGDLGEVEQELSSFERSKRDLSPKERATLTAARRESRKEERQQLAEHGGILASALRESAAAQRTTVAQADSAGPARSGLRRQLAAALRRSRAPPRTGKGAGGGEAEDELLGEEGVSGESSVQRLERQTERGERRDERNQERDERIEERHARWDERREERHRSAHEEAVTYSRSALASFALRAGLDAPRRGYIKEGWAANPMFCFLMANNTIVQQPADMFGLEDTLVRHAKHFIRTASEAGAPWFLYWADLHPHTALFNHPRFGPGPPGPFESNNGQYGQVLRELDWAVGELLETLDELGQTEHTLVWFTSDNGPYREEGHDLSGRTGGLQGGKGQTWEGGIRVPAIVRWPGVIPEGTVSDAPVRALDVLPTVCAFAGVQMPRNLIIDGVDQSEFFQKPVDASNGWLSQKKVHMHYCGTRPLAARYMNYKVHWATQRWQEGYEDVCTQCCPAAGYTAGLFGSTTLCQCDDSSLDFHDPPLVFNIRRDPNETTPLALSSSEVEHAVAMAEEVRGVAVLGSAAARVLKGVRD